MLNERLRLRAPLGSCGEHVDALLLPGGESPGARTGYAASVAVPHRDAHAYAGAARGAVLFQYPLVHGVGPERQARELRTGRVHTVSHDVEQQSVVLSRRHGRK